MDYWKERERIEDKQLEELKKTNIPKVGQYINFSCLNQTVQLDGDYTSEQLRLLADALDKAIAEYQSIDQGRND